MGILKQVGTTRSPSRTRTSRHRRIFWHTCRPHLRILGRVPLGPCNAPIGQLAYRTGANHHGVEVFGHAVRLGVQQVAWVTQQIQNSGVNSTDLLQLQILFFIGEEGVKVDGQPRCCRMSPPSSALLGNVLFLVLVAAEMHDKPEHAPREDCVVTHAGPIHCPGVNIM